MWLLLFRIQCCRWPWHTVKYPITKSFVKKRTLTLDGHIFGGLHLCSQLEEHIFGGGGLKLRIIRMPSLLAKFNLQTPCFLCMAKHALFSTVIISFVLPKRCEIFTIFKFSWYKKQIFKALMGSCLRTFALIVFTHPYCARKFTRHVIKWTFIGLIAIAIALPGFNGLGRSVTPTFLSRNSFHLQLSPCCRKMNKISRFLSTGHRILPKLWSR